MSWKSSEFIMAPTSIPLGPFLECTPSPSILHRVGLPGSAHSPAQFSLVSVALFWNLFNVSAHPRLWPCPSPPPPPRHRLLPEAQQMNAPPPPPTTNNAGFFLLLRCPLWPLPGTPGYQPSSSHHSPGSDSGPASWNGLHTTSCSWQLQNLR